MENLNYNHLWYFHVVAEEGTLTAAAKRLGVTKPTISAQLRQLEETLGHDLFDRRRGRLQLNTAGRVAFRHTRKMFEASEGLVRHFRQERDDAANTLRLGVANPVARSVAADFFVPLLELSESRTVVRSGPSDRLRQQLRDLELDLVLLDEPPANLVGSSMDAVLLERTPIVGVSGPQVTATDLPSALAELPVARHVPDSPLRAQVDGWLHEQDLETELLAETDDVMTLLAYAATGHCVAFVPQSAARQGIAEGRLRMLGTAGDATSEVYGLYVDRDVPELVERAMAQLKRA